MAVDNTARGLAGKALSAGASLADGSVTYAKIQNVSATDKLLGRSTAGAGVVEEITLTAAGRALIDDADASAQRTTLGLAIGTNVQAYSANLDEYAAVNPTAAGLAILDDADAAAQRTTLGVPALAAANTFSGGVQRLAVGASAAVVAKGNSGTSTQTFDVSAGTDQSLTNTGAHTWAFSNFATGMSGVVIHLTNGGANVITFPTINWFKGDGTTSTTFSTMGVTLASSGFNTVFVWSPDGGATLYGKAC